MPRYHFHLSARDRSFRDDVGCEVTDVAAAHSRGVQLAYRVTMFAALADGPPDLRRWTVQITDGGQRPVITVIVPFQLETQRRCPEVSDARTLQEGLQMMLKPTVTRSRHCA